MLFSFLEKSAQLYGKLHGEVGISCDHKRKNTGGAWIYSSCGRDRDSVYLSIVLGAEGMELTDVLGPVLRGWSLPLLIFAVGYLMVGTPHSDIQPRGCSLLEHDHFVVYSKRVVTPNGVYPASVEVKEGRIVSVIRRREAPRSGGGRVHVLNYENAVVMPGLIDVHVHLNEPGREEWEGFRTGTMAAAAGGITTVIDMPLNSFPTTTTKEFLNLKREAAKGSISVDVGFWGGLVPGNVANLTILEELLNSGVMGLKSFMCPSGINDFPMTTASDIQAALPVLAKYGRPILVHAEVVQPVEDTPLLRNGVGGLSDDAKRLHSTYLSTRPPSWEQEAVRQLMEVAKDTARGGPAEGARIHVVHVSDAGGALQYIKEAKENGLEVSVETCPHYLAFASEEIPQGDTRYKCAPPIRNASNRDKLWEALKQGSIDMLSSDHSPAPPELKEIESGDFLKAWGGISSLQFMLPVTWTTGRSHHVTVEQIARWWSSSPAKLANLDRKGSIQFGKDADLVIWDPEQSYVIDENYTIYHKHKVTPYAGWTLSGRIITTFVRGQQVYSEGKFPERQCGMRLSAL
ncbi:hypothetical protein R1flu_023954 [Riccia fluitans]|uniref:allantoinase n=1 Tax=Riccia fluitans TaxID=41844 RepID=A0ABD1XTH2_9MARC